MVGGGASVALDDPATRRAVDEYRQTAWRALAVGSDRLMMPSSASPWNERLSIDRSDTVLLAWGGPDWAVAAPPDRSVLVVVKESSGPYPER
jgi:hypothetical protein